MRNNVNCVKYYGTEGVFSAAFTDFLYSLQVGIFNVLWNVNSWIQQSHSIRKFTVRCMYHTGQHRDSIFLLSKVSAVTKCPKLFFFWTESKTWCWSDKD